MPRLTKYKGYNSDGTPKVEMVKHDGFFPENMQEVLRKLAKYEDMEELMISYIATALANNPIISQ